LGLIFIPIAFFFVGVVSLWLWIKYSGEGPYSMGGTLVIEPGDSVVEIAKRLSESGLIQSSTVFKIGLSLEGLGQKMRAGEFRFGEGWSSRQVAHHIAFGKTVQRRLTIPEGVTKFMVIKLVNSAEGLSGKVKIEEFAEGSLFPDTYFYEWGEHRLQVMERMKQRMDTVVQEIWSTRKHGLFLRSPSELVVLASIIEKEARQPEERGRISAVFNNRLKINMKLQADPTVIYALTQGRKPFGRKLFRQDLRFQSPFNTYLRLGLPPAPIASPGKASLLAAAQPSESSDLYFVSDGKGGHLFAATLSEHNKNVEFWRKSQR
jgi:UPF0755 protein